MIRVAKEIDDDSLQAFVYWLIQLLTIEIAGAGFVPFMAIKIEKFLRL